MKIKYNKKTNNLIFDKKIAGKCGMNSITDDGMTEFAKNYSVMYQLSGFEIDKIFQILRFYDIRFQILIDCSSRNIYLLLFGKYETEDAAINDFKVVEGDLMKNLTGFNCRIKRLELSERMSLIHRISKCHKGFINTENYTIAGDWIEDICLRKIKEALNHLAFSDGENENVCVSCLDMRKIKLEKEDIENMKYLLLDFAPVEDSAVKRFMENQYLDLEKMQHRFETENPVLAEILFDKQEENRRLYTLLGIYGVFEESEIQNEKYPPCHGLQKEMYSTIIPNGITPLLQMHLYKTEESAEFMRTILGGIENV